jgi:hypothetical protein
VCGQTTSSRGQQPSPETQAWDLQPTQATTQTPGESLTLYLDLSEAAVVEHYFENGKRLLSWQGKEVAHSSQTQVLLQVEAAVANYTSHATGLVCSRAMRTKPVVRGGGQAC